MMLRHLLLISIALGPCAPICAQERDGFDRVELRVSSVGPGVTIVVDRG